MTEELACRQKKSNQTLVLAALILQRQAGRVRAPLARPVVSVCGRLRQIDWQVGWVVAYVPNGVVSAGSAYADLTGQTGHVGKLKILRSFKRRCYKCEGRENICRIVTI